ncbi:MAG: ATP-dependent DNA helicase PcrA [Candidatus Fervidibacterota bacterium]
MKVVGDTPMNPVERLLSELDEQQRAAVTAPDGPVMVFAGAGSGKTRVLTYRIAYLLLARRIPPHRLFAVTFTNKAAEEMRQRLEGLVGKAVEAMWLGTFHAACARMLRQHGQVIGLPPNFVIYDEDDQRSLLKAIFKELNLDTDRYPIAAIHAAISHAKNEMVTPDELMELAETPFQQVVGRVYRHYQEALRQAKAVDFDDLLWLTLRMLREHPPTADYYQTRFLHVLVDEYQDVNRAQHELTLLLASKHRNLFVIGDDDQNIYSWRGSDVRLMLELPKRFPDLQIFTLEQNYRSTQAILDTAWHVIRHNKHRHEKRLQAVRKEGEPVVLFRAQDDHEEAAFVASIVTEWVREGRYRYRDFAVIYRINAQSRPFEEIFIRWGIPYRVVGALRFYERKEVKDILAYLRLLVNPADEVSLRRVINLPPRGIGERTLERLHQFALQRQMPILEAILRGDALSVLDGRAYLAVRGFAELLRSLKAAMDTLTLPQLIQKVVDATLYADYIVRTEGQLVAQERMENLAQLVAASERQFAEGVALQTLPRFLEQLALLSPQDETDWRQDAVTLITAHSAKGLEFPVVFVAGLEEGLFPHARSLDDAGQLEEERRLFYVALTRAKDHAFLTYAQRRGWLTGNFSETRYANTEPSRFLNEVPLSLLEEWRGVPTPQGFLRLTTPPASRPPERKPLDIRELVRGIPVRRASELVAPRETEQKQISTRHNPLRLEQVRVGMRVRHRQFGTGTVVAIEPDEKLPLVVVRFDDRTIGEKRLALEFAPLEEA